jgi:esterase/lipase
MARRRAYAAPSPSKVNAEVIVRWVLRILVLSFVIFLALVGVGAGLTYFVTTNVDSQESVTPQSYLLSSYIPLSFTDHSGGEHDGWLLLGLRGAPAVILCPGYDSNRSDLLSLGTILRDNHFNVYIFNFHGPKAKERFSDLGPRQASDLMAAIDMVTRQPDVNPNRLGIYGTSVGGYAALGAAEANPKVRALVIDSTYPTPESMFDTQIEHLLGGSSGIFHVITDAEFHLLGMSGNSRSVQSGLSKLSTVPKLFVSGRDNPELAAMTETLYNQSPDPKQLLVMEHLGSGMTMEDEKREFENQTLIFFLKNLSLRSD